MNTQLSINTFLTEKFLGKCWHEFDRTPLSFGSSKCTMCLKCNRATYLNPEDRNPDLFTHSGFFLLWEKAQKEEWWDDLIYYHVAKSGPGIVIMLPDFVVGLIKPLTFPTLLAEYLGWKE